MKSPTEFPTAISGPTTNSEPCYQFTSVYFETGSSTAPYIVNASFNVLLALVTTVANTLVLSAIRKNTSLHLPSKLLLGTLVLTDLGVGLVAQPLFVAFLVAKIKGNLSISCFTCASSGITVTLLGCVSVMTITAISLDRYIAFYFHLRYRDIVTTRRVFSILVVIWMFAGFFGFLWLRNPILHGYVLIAFSSVSFIIITLSYTMIYRGLRHQHGNQVTDQAQVQTQQPANPMNLARYRRSASNMLWIYGLFVLCDFPFILIRIVEGIVGGTVIVQCLLEFAVTVVCFNSCLNPLLYCYRLPEIRASVLETLYKICGRSSQQ